MSATNPIAVRGVSSVQVEIAADAYARRKTIIEAADFAPKVITCPDTRQEVATALADVNRLLKEVEKGRTEVKAPVLAVGRTIDATAEEFSAPLAVAQKRLQTILTEDAKEQARIAREAEEKRQAELRRQQTEAAAKQAEIDRQAREAEQARLAAERAEREAKTADARAAAQEAARKAAEESSALAAQKEKEAEAARLQQAELLRAPSPAAPKAAGTAVSNPWVFDVTDIKALHAARPELVDLVVRRNDIITRIRQGEREIPGLRIYQDTKVVVRT